MQKVWSQEDNLWKRFKEGNDDAFYCLYDQYADNLFKYGIHFSKDRAFIQDCIHDLFLELYKYRKKLSETDNIQFYLYRSLRRIIHKEQLKTIPIFNEEMNRTNHDDPVFSHEDTIIANETEEGSRSLLNKAMEGLSNHQREGLSLKFEHERSYTEIAQIMEISVESARTLIYRALKELRKCIEEKRIIIQLLFFLSLFPFRY